MLTVQSDDPVMILGFGRSGSTWVADVVGRLTGKLMLNEPLNPGLLLEPGDLAWGTRNGVERLGPALRLALQGRLHEPWLLRQYFAPLADADHDAMEEWWRKPIVGFKDIHHCCFGIPWLVEEFGTRIAYVSRDAAPVVRSVVNRPSFWAWGWPNHYEIMMDASVFSPAAKDTPLEALRDVARVTRSLAGRVAVLWAAVEVAAAWTTPPGRWWKYEHLVDNDSATWERLCATLDVPWEPGRAQLAKPSRTASGNTRELTVDERGEVERIELTAWSLMGSRARC